MDIVRLHVTLCHLPFHRSDLWIHLESLTELVLKMVVQVEKLDPETKKAIQMHLQYTAHHQISVLEWEMRTTQDKLAIPLEQHVAKFYKSAVILNKAILYLMKGFLPLLCEFSSELCAHICGQNIECTKALTVQKMELLYEFTKTLQVILYPHSYMNRNTHIYTYLPTYIQYIHTCTYIHTYINSYVQAYFQLRIYELLSFCNVSNLSKASKLKYACTEKLFVHAFIGICIAFSVVEVPTVGHSQVRYDNRRRRKHCKMLFEQY